MRFETCLTRDGLNPPHAASFIPLVAFATPFIRFVYTGAAVGPCSLRRVVQRAVSHTVVQGGRLELSRTCAVAREVLPLNCRWRRLVARFSPTWLKRVAPVTSRASTARWQEI